MRQKYRSALLIPAAALVALSGCARPAPKALVKSARLGIFFGGQVEERREIPFELDPGKQTQGFRVEFSEPLASETDVEWRIDPPKTDADRRRKPKSGSEPPALAFTGKDVARAGETSLDHVLSFHPGDPLGLWNVRVVVRGRVVIDRPFEVYDAAARKRLVPRDGG
jgi:hypothetical protein